jgi:3-hydroxyacyl-CoA dehydrogenase
MTRPDPASVRRVAVVGTGTIGASWAALFLARGLAVRASDPAPDAAEKLGLYIERAWPTLTALGLAPGARPDAWRMASGPEEAVADAEFVIENAPERIELKQELYARLDGAAPVDSVIASSTSALPMSEIQARCKHPERTVTAHPFNPPHLIPLVELVGGEKTAEATIAWCEAFMRGLGKETIRLKREIYGHIANRMQTAIFREAVHLVSEGYASVEDVDKAIAYGPGLRWAIYGPCLTFHLGGGDGGMSHFFAQFGPWMEERWRGLGTPKLTPETQAKIIDGVDAEAAGRSIHALAAERDACLIELIAALRRARARPAT